MKAVPLNFSAPVCLVGGGALTREMLEQARAISPVLVAADGAANLLADFGLVPEAVVGDMDSVSDIEYWREHSIFLQIEEQDSTDFAKCLRVIEAPFYLGVGFTGRRIDHMLAVFSAMLENCQKTVVLIGEEEVIALIPPENEISLNLELGAIVSFYPLTPVTGTASDGLKWSIDKLAMQAGQQVGTSNLATSPQVVVGFDRPGALLMLERKYLRALLDALGCYGG